MPVAREGQFLVSRTMGSVPYLGIESSLIEECINEVVAAGYKAVFGSPSFGFHETTLQALNRLPDLEEVWFWDIDLVNVEDLYHLKRLKSFGVQPKRPAMDFGRLSSIVDMTLTYREGDRGISLLDQCKRFDLWHFSPKSKNFESIQLPPNLIDFGINWAAPKSLRGLDRINTLERLEIHRCRNLTDISSIPELFPNLRHLVVSNCPKVDEDAARDVTKGLSHARHVFIQGKKFV